MVTSWSPSDGIQLSSKVLFIKEERPPSLWVTFFKQTGEVRGKSINAASPHGLLVHGGGGKEGRVLPGERVEQLKAAVDKHLAPVGCAVFARCPVVVYCSKEVGVEPLPLHHVWVEHPLHFIFGKKIVVAVAVGITGGVKDEEPLE